MKVDISVVVPVYNVEKYIERCLNSLKRQECISCEFVIVNDGSSDSSLQIINKICADDRRFVVIDQKNGGWGSAVMRGIAEAKGAYLSVLDSDDWLKKDALSEIYRMALDGDYDIVIGGKTYVYSDGREVQFDQQSAYLRKPPENGSCEFGDRDFFKFYHLNASPHGKLFRTSICRDIPLPLRISYGDNALYYLALLKAEKVFYTNSYFSYCHLIDRSGNSRGADAEKRVSQHVDVFLHILEKSESCDTEKKQQLANRLLYTTARLYRESRTSSFLNENLKAKFATINRICEQIGIKYKTEVKLPVRLYTLLFQSAIRAYGIQK
ncbi:MAG: glycosyltransferase family 2 protein [Candidatus Latescibacteria bacterium]|nr:glycosyltransferase family 2 protein [Candidatus Latescibacterota bacterium]